MACDVKGGMPTSTTAWLKSMRAVEAKAHRTTLIVCPNLAHVVKPHGVYQHDATQHGTHCCINERFPRIPRKTNFLRDFTEHSPANRWTGSSGEIFFLTNASMPSRYTNTISCVGNGRSRRSPDAAGISAARNAMRRQPRHGDGPYAHVNALVRWRTSHAGEHASSSSSSKVIFPS